MNRFLETIKIEDQKPFLLPLHQQRLNDTLKQLSNEEKTIDLEMVIKSLELDEDGLYKLRVLYDLELNYTTQLVPYAISPIGSFQLFENNSFDYSFKYEDRSAFEQMKKQAKAEEIIIVKNNCITDTSYSNIVFQKENQWYTPKTYLLNGVQRQSLLNDGKITEMDITLDNIKEFSHFQLINTMNELGETFIYPIEKITNLPSTESLED